MCEVCECGDGNARIELLRVSARSDGLLQARNPHPTGHHIHA